MRVSELKMMCSSSNSYMEVYTRICSTTTRPYEVSNYIWTAVLGRSVDGIPRREKGREEFERSVKTWQENQKKEEKLVTTS